MRGKAKGKKKKKKKKKKKQKQKHHLIGVQQIYPFCVSLMRKCQPPLRGGLLRHSHTGERMRRMARIRWRTSNAGCPAAATNMSAVMIDDDMSNSSRSLNFGKKRRSMNTHKKLKITKDNDINNLFVLVAYAIKINKNKKKYILKLLMKLRVSGHFQQACVSVCLNKVHVMAVTFYKTSHQIEPCCFSLTQECLFTPF